MITVIVPESGKLPCVLQVLKRAGLTKIQITSWCQRTVDGEVGLLQMPAQLRICQACDDALKAYSAPMTAAPARIA